MNALDILFPKRRAEIFRLLFADSSKILHMREIERLSGIAVGALTGELANLCDSGLLRQRRDGNRLYFRANQDHPLYPELHSLVLKTSGLDAQISQALNGLSGITLAFIFGSFASDSAGPQSDMDLFVVGAIGLRQLAPPLRVTANALGREINPYVTTPETLAQKIKDKDAFILNVLKSPKRWIIGSDHELENLAK
jgi:predicted nucleotidyltransferase